MGRKPSAETTPAQREKQAQARHVARVALLNKSANDVCDRIADRASSFTTRAIRARSVAPKIVEAGFAAMEKAIADGRARYTAAQKSDDVGRIARVDLTKL